MHMLPEKSEGQLNGQHALGFAAHIGSTLLIAECHETDTNVDTCLSDLDDGNPDNSKDSSDSVMFEGLGDQLRSGDS